MNTTCHFTSSSLLHNSMSPLDNKECDQAHALRNQAFDELQQSIQSYNNSFVMDMRYQEERLKKRQLGGKTTSVTDYSNDLSSDDDNGDDNGTKENNQMMNELAIMLQAGSINDYTPVLEWESKQNMPDSGQLTYGSDSPM